MQQGPCVDTSGILNCIRRT